VPALRPGRQVLFGQDIQPSIRDGKLDMGVGKKVRVRGKRREGEHTAAFNR
jgi:hypothetical protein